MMTLSLRQLCLLQICNDMMDGVLHGDLESASPLMRRQVFVILAGREQLSNPNCLKYMKQLLFDDSLYDIDVLPVHQEVSVLRENAHTGFLQFLDKHFRSFPGVADRITSLRLAALTEEVTKDTLTFLNSRKKVELTTDLRAALQLISQCRNLKSLSLVTGHNPNFDAPHFLQLLADALRHSKCSGLETLELIHQFFNKREFSPSSDQKLVFGHLKSVRLQCILITEKSYRRFLDCCRKTLECLVLDQLLMDSCVPVPVQLVQLTSLEVIRGKPLNLPDMAERCPKLRNCHFDLIQSDIDSKTVSSIQSLLPSLEDCVIYLTIELIIPPLLKTLLAVAGDKVTKLSLLFEPYWRADTILPMIMSCPNLHSIWAHDSPTRVANLGLEPLFNNIFGNKELAEKLLKLDLETKLNERTLDLLFKNFVNLEKLHLKGVNAQPTDEHLKTWVERGARPSDVHFDSSQITDQGLNQLIVACGSNLKKLEINCQIADVNSVIKALTKCCLNLECISIPGVEEQVRDTSGRFRRRFLSNVFFF